MTRSHYCYCIVLVGACGLGACGDPTEQRADQARPGDSATIVLRGEEAAPTATKDSPRSLTFDSTGLFFYGVSGAARLEENRIAVANRLTSQIFVFDSTGTFVRSFGRKGGGPGEFQNLASIISVGDTIVAFDNQTRRVSLFTSDGALIDDYGITAPTEASPVGGARLVGNLGARRLLIWSQAMPTEAEMNMPLNTPGQIPLILFSIDSAGNAPVMLGRFPGDEVWVSDASGRETNYGLAPFGGRTWFGAIDGKAIVLRNTDSTLRVLLPTGIPHVQYRGQWRVRDVTNRDRDRHMANWRTRLRSESYWQTLSSLYEQSFPATMPYYRDAVVGTDALVWIEPYESWSPDGRLYIGYDSAGTAVGTVSLPGRDNLLEIGNGVAIVHRFEEDGAERIYVQPYRLGRD